MIKLDTKIVMKNKPEATDLSGEKVMIDFKSGNYFLIKGVGNDIWDMLEDGITIETIVKKLLEIYDIDKKTCIEEVTSFLIMLKNKDFIDFESN